MIEQIKGTNLPTYKHKIINKTEQNIENHNKQTENKITVCDY